MINTMSSKTMPDQIIACGLLKVKLNIRGLRG